MCGIVAVMQTLAGKDNLPELLDHYGQVIVDECHHLDGQSMDNFVSDMIRSPLCGNGTVPCRLGEGSH